MLWSMISLRRRLSKLRSIFSYIFSNVVSNITLHSPSEVSHTSCRLLIPIATQRKEIKKYKKVKQHVDYKSNISDQTIKSEIKPPPPNIFDESHNYRLVRRKAKRTAQRINALRYLVIEDEKSNGQSKKT